MVKDIWNRTSGRRRLLGAMVVLALLSAPIILKDRAHVDFDKVVGLKPLLTEPPHVWWPVFNPGHFVGWPDSQKPKGAVGLKVTVFAENLNHPHWLYTLPNGDVLVAETEKPISALHKPGFFKRLFWYLTQRQHTASADRIILLRDSNHDGLADQKKVFLDNLHSPFGMVLKEGRFYVANSDAIFSYSYKTGEDHLSGVGQKIIDLPAGDVNQHWTRNIILSPDGHYLYVAIGSASNIGEKGMALEQARAAIWEVDLKNNSHRIYAGGMRNPIGMAYEPSSKALWAVVDERNGMGSDMVPDYLTRVDFGDFYGWPQFYWGGYPDRRIKKIYKPAQSTVAWPDYSLGPHVSPLGLVFADTPESGSVRLGTPFTKGAFISEHGSLYRNPWSGYQVVFVPFNNKGEPQDKAVTVLSGFRQGNDVYGTPAGMTGDGRGALLVADDAANRIWRVSKG
ncbi:MAG: PQQ-dependent sugar dehydrogenase [Zymomonas mobilis subsp. pomaceae]|uniref:L-sorbosone dehydrogenase n=1 Tax=Zymomonas mobilis subsp. pomaceae (strain ATCC 29192 / DSM 22645 / JCM 10191 / CCUG 17912 / NBRC 13757 / NCIMB 11200 / NRRL B-4491 / Barker I) TaxID=579138 RepID=F8ETH1_ZYMMT|nr:PQQ-dependent sugar dehydrogenase [Zymomonas mobilis]AEI37996.1 L-sorbosone dehydrogenase [Zymomonas mobilis subsp. pomaceae ATCC 29192]MDX5949364.1 PQQ-dependent sugar dehydrogenase [Zymomonas mobilis subsp. pomaceae]GEB89106.1 sorbosone dehydrogenase [Zymomonas mobilis subsp. pomaceae]